jgi:sulfotransferase 6B1
MAKFVQNRLGRAAMLTVMSNVARLRFWDSGPRVFLNSIPKAGTHLLTATLEANSPLFNCRRHLQMHKLNSLAEAGQREYEVALDAGRFASETRKVRPGQFYTAHIFYDAGIHQVLREHDVRSVFMVRDPRDILISAMHYARGLRRHPRHALYAQEITTPEAQFDLELYGRREAPFVRPLKDRLQHYAGWRESPDVLTVRFEDLVGARGGMSDDVRNATFERLSAHLGVPVTPQKTNSTSATFRKGQAFGWKQELTPDQIRKVAEACGEEIAALGYDI